MSKRVRTKRKLQAAPIVLGNRTRSLPPLPEQPKPKAAQVFNFAVKHGRVITSFQHIIAAFHFWQVYPGSVLMIRENKRWRRLLKA